MFECTEPDSPLVGERGMTGLPPGPPGPPGLLPERCREVGNFSSPVPIVSMLSN